MFMDRVKYCTVHCICEQYCQPRALICIVFLLFLYMFYLQQQKITYNNIQGWKCSAYMQLGNSWRCAHCAGGHTLCWQMWAWVANIPRSSSSFGWHIKNRGKNDFIIYLILYPYWLDWLQISSSALYLLYACCCNNNVFFCFLTPPSLYHTCTPPPGECSRASDGPPSQTRISPARELIVCIWWLMTND